MTQSRIKNQQIRTINHIAIIMDGNRRWAKKNNLTKINGHKAGVKNAINLLKLINNEKDLKIRNITLYIFSKDNWKRPVREITGLFDLIKFFYHFFEKTALEENFIIRHIGSLNKVPPSIKILINRAINATKKNSGIKVNLAFNYSGKEEIISAFKKIKNKEKFSIKEFENNLFTSDLPNPEIIIRTGGNKRLSDFLLWQSAYSEFFFTKTLWPDFKLSNLKKILDSFDNIKRNYGS